MHNIHKCNEYRFFFLLFLFQRFHNNFICLCLNFSIKRHSTRILSARMYYNRMNKKCLLNETHIMAIVIQQKQFVL